MSHIQYNQNIQSDVLLLSRAQQVTRLCDDVHVCIFDITVDIKLEKRAQKKI